MATAKKHAAKKHAPSTSMTAGATGPALSVVPKGDERVVARAPVPASVRHIVEKHTRPTALKLRDLASAMGGTQGYLLELASNLRDECKGDLAKYAQVGIAMFGTGGNRQKEGFVRGSVAEELDALGVDVDVIYVVMNGIRNVTGFLAKDSANTIMDKDGTTRLSMRKLVAKAKGKRASPTSGNGATTPTTLDQFVGRDVVKAIKACAKLLNADKSTKQFAAQLRLIATQVAALPK